MSNTYFWKSLALYGASFDERGGHVAVRLKSGRPVGFGRRVHPFDDDTFSQETAALNDPREREFVERDQSTVHAHRAICALARLDAEAIDVTADRRLTAAGIAERLGPARKTALQAIAAQGSALDAIEAQLTAEERDLFTVPRIGTGDVQAALDAKEVREWFAALTQEQRLEFLDHIAKGDAAMESLLLSLRRSPIPLPAPTDEVVEHAWRAAVAKREPARAAALEVARDNFTWAQATVAAAAHYALPLLDMMATEIVRALGEHRAQAKVFEISDSAAAAVPAQPPSGDAAKAAA